MNRVQFVVLSAIALALPACAQAASAANPWSGPYVGLNFGGEWGHASTQSSGAAGGAAGQSSYDRSGVVGGGQIGYNWMASPQWMLGMEGDISGSTGAGHDNGCGTAGCSQTTIHDNDIATLRLRLGYRAAQSPFLIYGTGGWGWINGRSDRTIVCAGSGCPATSANSAVVGQESSPSATDDGWVAGAGVEWLVAPHWTVRGEYLHMQVDHAVRDFTYPTPSADLTAISQSSRDMVRMGINYAF